jgi:hypothetical protein
MEAERMQNGSPLVKEVEKDLIQLAEKLKLDF